MPSWIVYTIGFTAQILFSSRLILQWILSEKSKQVLVPRLFWQFSLLASFLLFVYGYQRNDFAIILGQSTTYFIYIRNLQLQNEWKKLPAAIRFFLWAFPVMVVIYFYNNKTSDMDNLLKYSGIPTWLIILGSVSLITFNLRFIYQWIYSESKKESLLPLGFWVLSFVGAFLTIIYALFRWDPVLFAGHFTGCIVYFRNIIILKKTDGKSG